MVHVEAFDKYLTSAYYSFWSSTASTLDLETGSADSTVPLRRPTKALAGPEAPN